MQGYIRFLRYKEEKLAASPVAKTISIVRRGILATSFSILGSEGTLAWPAGPMGNSGAVFPINSLPSHSVINFLVEFSLASWVKNGGAC